jgi:hypothetical protein
MSAFESKTGTDLLSANDPKRTLHNLGPVAYPESLRRATGAALETSESATS